MKTMKFDGIKVSESTHELATSIVYEIKNNFDTDANYICFHSKDEVQLDGDYNRQQLSRIIEVLNLLQKDAVNLAEQSAQ